MDSRLIKEVFLSRFVLLSNLVFLFLLLFVNSNISLLAIVCVYLSILIVKLQNYRNALYILFITLLPFTLGRNLLEIVLLKRSEIYGFAHFDIVYFLPFYLADACMLLLYQNYLSHGFGKWKNKTASRNFLISAAFLAAFIISTFFISMNHIVGQLLMFSSVYLLKYLLIFLLPYIVKAKNLTKEVFQVVLSGTLFQSLLILFEQFKGGDLGSFIEMRLPGIDYGTWSSEAAGVFRANGTFNEPNIAAIFLFINLCLILFQFIQNFINNRLSISYFELLVLPIVLMALVFTGSRSVMFLGMVALLIFYFKYKSFFNYFLKKIIARPGIKVYILVGVLVLLPYLFARIETLGDTITETGSFSYRMDLNKYSLMLSDYSLFGIGIDMTPYFLARNFKTAGSNMGIFDPAPAHNIFIQILTEEGVVGFCLFSLFLLFAFRDFIKTPKLVNGYFLASLAFLVASQFHPAFTTHPEILSFFMLFLGTANASVGKLKTI